MADELAGQRPDAHQGDQVTERHDRADRLHRDDVAEDGDQVVHLLEPAPGAGVDVGQLVGGRHASIDQRSGPDRHGTVGEDRTGVEREADGQHAHARDVPVHERESRQRGQRRAEEHALGRGVEPAQRDLDRDADDDDARVHDHRPVEVRSEGATQPADGCADNTGGQDGEHRRRR